MFDIFKTVGNYIDHFEILMNYIERKVEHEVKNRPKVDRKYVDFVVKRRHVSILRGPRSLTNIHHQQHSIKLRNKILSRKFPLQQKYTVIRRTANHESSHSNTLEGLDDAS